ncbi:type III-B CRISPR module RAMP protein Cmr6 [Ruminococcaceae bacterium OttesenSCG-928-A16]|nr:type III-B CRISPR module RAMP protein Cmr6 [Ruminococcaceae bacterium OttesenSCG-928-A16]
MQNLNYLLNNHYYAAFTYRHFAQCNLALVQSKFMPDKQVVPHTPHSFALQTTYPGLLLGLGGTHQAGTNIEGNKEDGTEIKLGFTLDYVTGLPIIPGSTVKGVLRSAFEKYRDDAIAADLYAEMKDIFGGDNNTGDDTQRGKCIFYDAIPVGAGKDGRLLGLDNITPHPSPLKDPIPLTMLKVIPGVTYLFRFDLLRCKNAERVKELFREILLGLGIGAKTNVGFGVLAMVAQQPEYRMLIQEGVVQSNSSAASSRVARQNPAAGVCQHPNCGRPAPQRPDGSYHRFCQPHYIEFMGKKRSK